MVIRSKLTVVRFLLMAKILFLIFCVIGRLSLYAQTDDRKRSFMWDKASGQWVDIDSHRDIRTAIKVASKTVAPELLSLPVSAPEGT